MTQATPDADALLSKWAPYLAFHPQEANMPSSVEWFLQRSDLYDDQGRQVVQQIMNDQRTDFSALVDTKFMERRNWSIRLENPASRAGDLNSAKCYGYMRPVEDVSGAVTYYDLTYYVFYPFNGNIFDMGALAPVVQAAVPIVGLSFFSLVFPAGFVMNLLGAGATTATVSAIIAALQDGVGMHEGDWEYVVCRVTPDGEQMVGLYTSAHSDEGKWSGGWSTDPEGRPTVYVARTSHAFYDQPGEVSRVAGMANDETATGGQVWDTRPSLVNIGYDPDVVLGISWQDIDVSLLDSPGDPALAINDKGLFVTTHQTGANYTAATGQITGGELSWMNGVGPMTVSGGGPMAVAMNLDNIVVCARSNKGKLFSNIGTFDTSDGPTGGSITWWPDPTTSFASGSDPSIAINDSGLVVAVTHGGGLHYYAGRIDPANKRIAWDLTPKPAFSPHGYYPVVAINNRNEVVVLHTDQSGGGTIYFSLGAIDPTTLKINFPVDPVRLVKGSGPRVSLNQEGEVMAVFMGTKHALQYGLGEITDIEDANRTLGKTIKWITPPTSYTTGDGKPAIGLMSDGTALEIHRSGTHHELRTAKIEMDSFSNWTPLNGQDWVRFSGHWGAPGTSPIIDIGPVTLSQYTDGPIGPAYKGSYIGGPEE